MRSLAKEFYKEDLKVPCEGPLKETPQKGPNKGAPINTAGLDTIFVQIYMDALPGVSKIRFFFLQIKLLSFCARIAPKRHKLQKIVKIEKNVKKPLFS